MPPGRLLSQNSTVGWRGLIVVPVAGELGCVKAAGFVELFDLVTAPGQVQRRGAVAGNLIADLVEALQHRPDRVVVVDMQKRAGDAFFELRAVDDALESVFFAAAGKPDLDLGAFGQLADVGAEMDNREIAARTGGAGAGEQDGVGLGNSVCQVGGAVSLV